ncbi:putative 5'-nucleotidase [Emiliania huxleyi CCMP1516]|uniref:5'-nucleotidase n=2 Tax=Emiliania huxleyi TaxID=2903 RepID=A0A0D3KPP9_EMIH1|nr:putative 5'-nucleotidase [Emiliania huxleyi CCMP1516]XP_005790163.1 putative 5'-nucleotidase [Emiliania huxleyi CCMP1516]EOD25657.1 putative 5'-nucleotidase [Emiliania huxleyi CCMP1516]EOD37734.1 putative 5'-nucleotidase [Emiliania huxleyi CCMP1516]|eukprot:XP_005778086.1 putative 5'-nucleotidase [Emiliania huxleyi CCMP1516]
MPTHSMTAAAAAGASLLIIYLAIRRRRRLSSSFLPTQSFGAKHEGLLRDARLDKLLVITDFDATLTTGDSTQCHDLVGFSDLLAAQFREGFAPLLDWQTNPLTDGAHALMVKYGQPPRSLIPRMVRQSSMVPRPGALKLLHRLALLNVPVLIVSAGLSDVIEEFLRQHDALTENITVCSNRLNYGADLAPQSVAPDPPITSFTKASAYRAAGSFFKHHAARRSLLVLGDSITDIDAATEVPYDHLISATAKYAESYDALVLGDHGSPA